MNPDLFDAQACIDWTLGQLPAFKERITSWLRDNLEVVFIEEPPDCPNGVLVAREKSDLPLAFNVEAGVYIHTLRSSLDILACVIGKREKVLDPQQIYFPFAESRADFEAGNYRGVKFVGQLSGDSRSLIEKTKPYKGGNRALWALHYLDIVRKHRRLLTTTCRPASFHIMGDDIEKRFFPIRTDSGYARMDGDHKHEIVFGILEKSGKPWQVQYNPCVSVAEASAIEGEVITVITEFASHAQAVIKLFDE